MANGTARRLSFKLSCFGRHIVFFQLLLLFLCNPEELIARATTNISYVNTESSSSIPRYIIDHCGLWIAPSTIENAGYGTYAGRAYKKGTSLYAGKNHDSKSRMGDLAIPFIDERWNNEDMKHHLPLIPFSYFWSGASLGMDHEGIQDVKVIVPGIPSTANALHDTRFINLYRGFPERYYRRQQEHRPDYSCTNGADDQDAKIDAVADPTSGSYTTYYNVHTMATRDIEMGEELFAGYHKNWFDQRQIQGVLPHQENVNSLPSASVTKKSLEWLWENGSCADLIYSSRSTIPNAGQGAFASCDLPTGSVVAIMPMMHITNRSFLMMMDVDPTTRNQVLPTTPPPKRKTKYQLWINYCFGHHESTLLLCPYSNAVSLINHGNQSSGAANVKLVWADPNKSVLRPMYLERSVPDLNDDMKTKLAMALVATRPIHQNEEIFLDYGPIWEAHWNRHVQAWTAAKDVKRHEYQSALDFTTNARTSTRNASNNETHGMEEDNSLLRDIFDLLSNPYPENLQLECHSYFWNLGEDDEKEIEWRTAVRDGNCSFLEDVMENHKHGKYWLPCQITQKKNTDRGRSCVNKSSTTGSDLGLKTLFDARIYFETIQKWVTTTGLPSVAFRIQDKPYTSDMFRADAFRHYIPIPDEIFPIAWRNKKAKSRVKTDK